MREALNPESGLNDGICVPIVVLLLGLAVGTQIEGGTMLHVARVVVEEIGFGLIVGLALTRSLPGGAPGQIGYFKRRITGTLRHVIEVDR